MRTLILLGGIYEDKILHGMCLAQIQCLKGENLKPRDSPKVKHQVGREWSPEVSKARLFLQGPTPSPGTVTQQKAFHWLI